jgi:hypothetical protein
MLTGCQPVNDNRAEIGMDWSVTPHPPEKGIAAFSMTLVDKITGQSVTGAQVQLEGNMSHPGMKPVLADAKEVATGRYEAPLEFTMAGDWFVQVNVTLADGGSVQRLVEIPGVRNRQSTEPGNVNNAGDN